ncbi:MAG: CvpA family protein [Desulfobacterales bacterium]|jgi:membrane protein required for colicin V production
MNLLDLLIIVIFVLCMLRGIFKGLITGVISILTLFVSFYVASNYCAGLTTMLSRWSFEIAYLKILGWLVIFLIIFVTANFLGTIAKDFLKVEFHPWVDGILGAGVSIAQGILVVSMLLFALTAFTSKDTSMITKSQLAVHAIPITEKMSLMVPKGIRHEFRQRIGSYQKVWDDDRQLL